MDDENNIDMISKVEEGKKTGKSGKFGLTDRKKKIEKHFYTLIQNGKFPAITVFNDRMPIFMIAAWYQTS